MISVFYNLVLASTYGSHAYNTLNYNGSNQTSGSGGLTNTGIAVATIVTVSALILLTALLVRIWKRPSKNQPPTDSGLADK